MWARGVAHVDDEADAAALPLLLLPELTLDRLFRRLLFFFLLGVAHFFGGFSLLLRLPQRQRRVFFLLFGILVIREHLELLSTLFFVLFQVLHELEEFLVRIVL